ANNTVINGTFSSPDTGVGNCAAGSVDALTGNINALKGCQTAAQLAAGSCQSGSNAIVHLAQTVNYPTPQEPATVPLPISAVPGSNQLTACGPTSASCPGVTGNYGDISYGGSTTVYLNPYINTTTTPPTCGGGVYYINSITQTGNATLQINPCPAGYIGAGQYFPVIVNIIGTNQADPLKLAGNGLANPSLNPAVAQ